MASVNKVIIIGNLGRDPEIRYTPDGATICNISIATTSQWKDKNSGERREETEWHRIIMYNRLAEIAGEFLKKGRSIYIEGRLRTRKWQEKDTGTDRYSTEVIADRMQMLGGRDGYEINNNNNEHRGDHYQKKTTTNQKSSSLGDGSDLMSMDDDIPF